MAKYTIGQFKEAYSIKDNTFKSYVRRGHVVKGADGLIDTDDPQNKVFLIDYEIKKSSGAVSASGGTNKKATTSKKTTTVKSVKVDTNKPAPITQQQSIYTDLDLRTRKAKAEREERENEIKRMELERKAGNLLPVDVVAQVQTVNFHTLHDSYFSALDNMVNVFVERFGGNNVDKVAISKELRTIYSGVLSAAKSEAEHAIKTKIKEFQEMRN